MKIYLVRHGDSLPLGRDDERSLSEKGVADIERLAAFIAKFNFKVAHVVHSLKYRTQQTAEILLASFMEPPPLEVNPDLDPMAPLSTIIEQIQQWNEDSVLVGHMPFMSRLVSRLTTGRENHHIVLFKPGTMVCLEQIQYDYFSINWMLNPDILM